MDRQPWVNWDAAGATSMNDRIRTRLQRILETHTPPPLPEGTAEKIQAVLEAAAARMSQA
jgi:trimethylamine:corrinoid methyltransferase-like protein